MDVMPLESSLKSYIKIPRVGNTAGDGLVSGVLGQGLVAGCCEDGEEPSCSGPTDFKIGNTNMAEGQICAVGWIGPFTVGP
jgi:hypothetical protein